MLPQYMGSPPINPCKETIVICFCGSLSLTKFHLWQPYASPNLLWSGRTWDNGVGSLSGPEQVSVLHHWSVAQHEHLSLGMCYKLSSYILKNVMCCHVLQFTLLANSQSHQHEEGPVGPSKLFNRERPFTQQFSKLLCKVLPYSFKRVWGNRGGARVKLERDRQGGG